MKYLRKYNESYINIEDIKDICLELTDLGIVISISSTDAYRNKNVIYFHNYNIHNGMKWNDVKDCLLRLKDYLGDNYDEMLIMSHAWAKADFEKYNNKRVLGVVILFKDEIEGSPEGDGGSGLSFLKDIYEI